MPPVFHRPQNLIPTQQHGFQSAFLNFIANNQRGETEKAQKICETAQCGNFRIFVSFIFFT